MFFSFLLRVGSEEASSVIGKGLFSSAMRMNKKSDTSLNICRNLFSLNPVLNQSCSFGSARNFFNIKKHDKKCGAVTIVDRDVCVSSIFVVVDKVGMNNTVFSSHFVGEVVAEDGVDEISCAVGVIDGDDWLLNSLGTREDFEEF